MNIWICCRKSARLVVSASCKNWPVASSVTDVQVDKSFEPVIKQD